MIVFRRDNDNAVTGHYGLTKVPHVPRRGRPIIILTVEWKPQITDFKRCYRGNKILQAGQYGE
jgi:hypothetical protein